MSRPPEIGRVSTEPDGASGTTSRRMFFLARRISSASGSKPVATTTSVNTGAICAAAAAVITPLAAITPPNALTGSVAWARACASATSAPTAMPHGLACLMIATAGPSWSQAARHAASAST
jgi:hypothetical protein